MLDFAVIPYIDGVRELINRILSSYNVKKVADNHFLFIPKNPPKDAVHFIPCQDRNELEFEKPKLCAARVGRKVKHLNISTVRLVR